MIGAILGAGFFGACLVASLYKMGHSLTWFERGRWLLFAFLSSLGTALGLTYIITHA